MSQLGLKGLRWEVKAEWSRSSNLGLRRLRKGSWIWLVASTSSLRNTLSFSDADSIRLIVLLTGFSFCLFRWMKQTVGSLTAASVAERRPGWIKLRNPCAPSRIGHTPAHLSPSADALQRPLLLCADCGWAAVFVGHCGSENTELCDGSQVQKATEATKSRTEGRERRAGGPFCCERSESPAGGAAWTICQWSLTLFSALLIQRMKKAGRQKASQWHSWFTQHASGFERLLLLFSPKYTKKKSLLRLPDIYDYYKDAVQATVLNMGLKLFKVNLGNIFRS